MQYYSAEQYINRVWERYLPSQPCLKEAIFHCQYILVNKAGSQRIPWHNNLIKLYSSLSKRVANNQPTIFYDGNQNKSKRLSSKEDILQIMKNLHLFFYQKFISFFQIMTSDNIKKLSIYDLVPLTDIFTVLLLKMFLSMPESPYKFF